MLYAALTDARRGDIGDISGADRIDVNNNNGANTMPAWKRRIVSIMLQWLP